MVKSLEKNKSGKNDEDYSLKFFLGLLFFILVVGIGLLLYVKYKGSIYQEPFYTNKDVVSYKERNVVPGDDINKNKESEEFFSKNPSYYIMQLFSIHNKFSYNYSENHYNMKIEWRIRGPSFAMDLLEAHIKQMDYLLGKNFIPRPRDPVFVLETKLKSYIETKVVRLSDEELFVEKYAKNECAYDIIRLHAQVVKGFFTTGRREAMKIHEVPQEILEKCRPYIN